MKLHEENKRSSLQNFKATRKLTEMLVLKTVKEVEGLTEICCSTVEGTQDLQEDDFSRREWRVSQSAANQLAVSNSGTAR